MAAAVLGVVAWVAPVTVAVQAIDSGVFDAGQQLYLDKCALCHGESGDGAPPAFPALAGNAQIGNLERTLNRIVRGEGAMPPFPDLGVEDAASLVNYVRNAWTNVFGPVTDEDVANVMEGFDGIGDTVSVWEGVYTEAQAARGQDVYAGACSACHGRRLNGAPDDPDMRSTPTLARAPFLRSWEGRSLATLFEYTRATMPESNPGSLTGDEYVDVLAYMLSVGGIPSGDEELRPDPQSLARAIVRQQP